MSKCHAVVKGIPLFLHAPTSTSCVLFCLSAVICRRQACFSLEIPDEILHVTKTRFSCDLIYFEASGLQQLLCLLDTKPAQGVVEVNSLAFLEFLTKVGVVDGDLICHGRHVYVFHEIFIHVCYCLIDERIVTAILTEHCIEIEQIVTDIRDPLRSSFKRRN